MLTKDDIAREGDFWDWRDELIRALREGGWIEPCSARGDCEAACREAFADPIIDALFEDSKDSYWPHIVRELRETGAWTREEIEAGRADLSMVRWIWCLCCDEQESKRQRIWEGTP